MISKCKNKPFFVLKLKFSHRLTDVQTMANLRHLQGQKISSQDPWVMHACDLYVFVYM